MAGWQEFTGLNRGYVLELYDKYRQDPTSVDAETRARLRVVEQNMTQALLAGCN